MSGILHLLRATSSLPAEAESLLHPHRPQSCGPHEWRLEVSAADALRLRRDLFEVARSYGLDLVLAPVTSLEISPRWVFFDGDATLLAGETVDELARVAGVHQAVATITARAMAGELDFEGALRERVALLRGLSEDALEQVVEAMPLSPGAEVAVRTLKSKGIAVGVLSGGFHFLLDRLEERLELDTVAGNRLEVHDGRLTGQVTGTVMDAARKARLLRRLLEDQGQNPAQAVAVGDGANDILMLEAAGLGLAYRGKPALLEVADGVIYGGGLDRTLDLLGLR
jgi:phosphoserine phosphatase